MMIIPLNPRPYQLVALGWQPTHVELWTEENNSFATKEPQSILNIAVSEEDRYYLLLSIAQSGRTWIRVPVGPRSLFARVGKEGNQFEVISPAPGEGIIPLSAGRVHHNDTVTMIDGNRLYILDTKDQWYEHALPDSVRVHDVSFDTVGRLWIAGAIPSSRIPEASSEVALYYQSISTNQFEYRPLNLDFITSAKTIYAGGMESLRTIDAEGGPLVATSDCSWFLDDPSSFLFMRTDQARWKVKRIGGRSIRKLIRFVPQMVLAVTVEGDIFALNTSGKMRLISKADDLRRLLLFYFPYAPSEARFIVRGADAKGGQIVIVTGLYVRVGQYLSWFVTAVCQSLDEGKTWAVTASTRPVDGDCELVDVAILT